MIVIVIVIGKPLHPPRRASVGTELVPSGQQVPEARGPSACYLSRPLIHTVRFSATYQYAALSPIDEMNIPRDDAGIIGNLHGLRPTTRATATLSNYRDASGATGGTYVVHFTPIHRICQLPAFRQMAEKSNADSDSRSGKCVQPSLAQGWRSDCGSTQGQNPYGNGRLSGKAATSSSLQHVPKRQKLDPQGKYTPSKYFSMTPSEPRTRRQRAQAVLSSSPSRRTRAADAIIIDEDDTSDAGDSSSKPVTLKTSSPDPMDIITPEPAYLFDQSKPSPIHQFSSSLEEMRRSPTDGESTARLRSLKQTEARSSTSRPNGDSPSAKATVTPRIGQANRSPGRSNVSQLVSVFEEHTTRRVLDLQAQCRKNNMKPKQVSLSASRSGVPQPSELRAPAADSAVTHYTARLARHSDVWLRFWFGTLKGQSDWKRRRLQFTLGTMVYRSGHPSARSNTRAPGQSHMGSGWSPQSATRELLNSFRATSRERFSWNHPVRGRKG